MSPVRRIASAMLVALALPALGQPAETVSLFNGRDLDGWHADVPAADNDADVSPSFVVREGMLVSMGEPQGHLITDDIHENYRLDIEYRFPGRPGNCGVLVHASTPRALYDMFPASIEVQMFRGNAGDFWCIQENIAVENMAERRSGEPETWGGGPRQSRRILNLTDDSESPVGEWNRMVIEAFEDRVRVWVNGDLVNDGFDCTARRGQIAVQAEGAEMEFRKLELTPITEMSDPAPREDWKIRAKPGALGPGPVRVFVLAGQSNMEGKAQLKLLDHQLRAPETAAGFDHLHRDGAYVERDDVWIDYLGRRGRLTAGYGSPGRVGVELQFGHAVGDRLEEPVLLVKTAWGGKSLQRDFRPPSAGLPSQAELDAILERTNADNRKHNRPEITIDDVRESFGHYYREMIAEVRASLESLGERFPELAGRGHRIDGFVWFQGWNDQYNGAELEYGSNMACFIRDVRRDLGEPGLPFVIGIMGQNGSRPASGAMLAIQEAQAGVAAMPEFRATVRAVRTDELVDARAEAMYPTWRDDVEAWERVGSDHPYHYLGSAVWFCRMGDAFAEAALGLIDEGGEG